MQRSEATGKSPFKLVTRRQPLTPTIVATSYEGSSPAAYKTMKEWHEQEDLARASLDKAAKKMKKWADEKRRHVKFKCSQLGSGRLIYGSLQKEIKRFYVDWQTRSLMCLGGGGCRGIRKKGLYVMKLGNKPKDKICLATIDENSTLWHRRLGHANMRLIQSLASKELVRNLPKLKFDQHFYDACKIGKQAHVSHKAKNVVSTTRCLKLLHMDLFVPSTVWSYEGNCYT
ncbi:retrovirus-related pol polyprotein from transposon TNT 1-94 [Tanacetum coccineum]|uniref:Retrovirus-related pol polyprotein from transposon TNT 1-94 n=1 Tax=Tanacetum coccineum TaxID=301880 RepID=A0ABQ5BJ30_9ASTR